MTMVSEWHMAVVGGWACNGGWVNMWPRSVDDMWP